MCQDQVICFARGFWHVLIDSNSNQPKGFDLIQHPGLKVWRNSHSVKTGFFKVPKVLRLQGKVPRQGPKSNYSEKTCNVAGNDSKYDRNDLMTSLSYY